MCPQCKKAKGEINMVKREALLAKVRIFGGILAVLLVAGAVGFYFYYPQIKINREVEFAQAALKAGDYTGAAECYRLALQERDLPELRGELRRVELLKVAFQRGEAFLGAGEYERAAAAFQKVMEEDPGNTEAVARFSASQKISQLLTLARQNEEQGNDSLAMKNYQAAARLDPGNAAVSGKIKTLSAGLALGEAERQLIAYYDQIYSFLKHCYQPAMTKAVQLTYGQKVDAAGLTALEAVKNKLAEGEVFYALKLNPELDTVNGFFLESMNSLSRTAQLLETAGKKKSGPSAQALVQMETARLQYRQFAARLNNILAKYPKLNLEPIHWFE